MFRYDKTAVNQSESQKKTQDDKFFRQHYDYENRIDEIRLQRRLQEEEKEIAAQEAEYLKQLQKDQKQEERDELNRLEHLEEQNRLRELREIKMRQMVRENSLEIRELESKLKLAYINKLRATQIREKEVERARIKSKEMEDRHLLSMEIEAAQLEDQIENETVSLNKMKYQKDLLDQVKRQQEDAEEEAMIQFVKDKAMIDEIVRRITEEDQKFLEEEFFKRERFKEEIEWFLKSQELQRKQEEARIIEEDRRILKYLKENELKEKRQKTEFIERIKRVQEMQNIVYNSLDKYRKDTTEEEELRFEIEMAKQEARDKAKEKQRLEKLMRERLQLRCTLDEQLKLKEAKIKAEKLEDELFKKQTLAKMAEDEKLEQMTQQKRRLKQIEHRREVERMIQEKQRVREEEKMREAEEMEKLKQAIQLRQNIIQEERLKLLKEHADKLLGYLPNGIFNEAELRALNL